MREAVYISDGFSMRDGPLGLENALKTKIYFGAFLSPPILFGSTWGYGSMVPQWGHTVVTIRYIRNTVVGPSPGYGF